ncbi:superoxide dismutase [Candidatus Carsonella ruddii]|nr:Fe-Mn family superoxide dismutase [Candidatus Carsonella ruddii (Diaphorina cf. continua)]
MFKIFINEFKNNNFLSKTQFNNHQIIYNNYKNNLNLFLIEKKIFLKNKLELIDIISDLPENEKNQFSYILGGYLNHEYFFKNISFNKNFCFGEIKNKILKTFNSYQNFEFNFIKCLQNFIGWGWVVINNKKLCILKTYENNNPMYPISLGGFNSVPLLCIDLHEHSYIIDYTNNKNLYISNFLKNINWYEVENRYQNYLLNI